MKMSWSMMLIIASVATSASGHGRVMDPVSRASAWRKGFGTEPNYDDDGLNCGGMAHQWEANGGRCGICGDAYDMPSPRPHEIGGKYGDGVIVAAFNPGSIISTAVQLTASHRGFWEFKICPDPEINNQGCFNKYPLELGDGGTRFYPTQGARTYHVNYRLPQGLKCEHCVLQWRYTAGNNWGVCQNGTQGLGCGNQEQFGACSDIAIGDGEDDFYNSALYEKLGKTKQERNRNEPVFEFSEISRGWVLEVDNNVDGDGLNDNVFRNVDYESEDMNDKVRENVQSSAEDNDVDLDNEIDIEVRNSKSMFDKILVVD